MKSVRFVLGFLMILFSITAPSGYVYSQQDALHIIDVVRLDRRFDQLVPLNLKIEKIAGGHKWVEGPVWNRQEGYLLFSDVPNNSIYRWQEDGGESLFLKRSGYTGKTPFEGAGAPTGWPSIPRDGSHWRNTVTAASPASREAAARLRW